jgi:hypothetical protein
LSGTFESRRVDRRTLFVGTASLAVGGVLVEAVGAEASASGGERTAAIVVAPASSGAVDVIPLESDRRIRVALDADTLVHAELESGSPILVQGSEESDGSIRAERVVRARFGVRADVDR